MLGADPRAHLSPRLAARDDHACCAVYSPEWVTRSEIHTSAGLSQARVTGDLFILIYFKMTQAQFTVSVYVA